MVTDLWEIAKELGACNLEAQEDEVVGGHVTPIASLVDWEFARLMLAELHLS